MIVDIHAHYFPKAYNDMLLRIGKGARRSTCHRYGDEQRPLNRTDHNLSLHCPVLIEDEPVRLTTSIASNALRHGARRDGQLHCQRPISSEQHIVWSGTKCHQSSSPQKLICHTNMIYADR